MLLTDLLDCGLSLKTEKSQDNLEIKGLTEDSRLVEDGWLFAAIRGTEVDGTKYISEAIAGGAGVIITYPEVEIEELITVIRHENPRYALGFLASKFFDNQPKHITAITGTNGKTSVADFCRQIWVSLGESAASIGTIGVIENGESNLSKGGSLTTPGIVELHKTISELASKDISHLALEASSHGLDQSRMAGVKVSVSAFTNLSRDHLDYHKDMDDYFSAKSKLFAEVMSEGGVAVLNADIEEYSKLKDICNKRGQRVIDYGVNAESIILNGFSPNSSGIKIDVKINGESREVQLPLYGDFQVSNILCALGIIMATNPNRVNDALDSLENIKSVKGRMERVAQTTSGASIFVDYAHTPDALEKALSSLRNHLPDGGKLLVVFGCGGDRDKGKRPKMGNVAEENADIVIITDDNPRTESPESIRAEIIAQCPKAIEVSDRKEAISSAVQQLQQGDILLIAGKGHESVQIIGDDMLDFDDAQVAREVANL